MPKLILRCNYLKNAPSSHLSNFMKYIATREGVEKINDTNRLLPATTPQKELIADILNKISDAKHMHEYTDYFINPTRENASEFITQALENNMDIIAKKKNYIDYLANRPGVWKLKHPEKQGIHGLFSDYGKPVVLSQAMEAVADHKGIIWTNVISLRREDAERLGYDKGEQWRELIRSKLPMFCKNFKIKTSNLRWYAAFHNESHHPHVHLVVYSSDLSEGYLTKAGIDTMRSELAHDIFRQDFMSIYEQKTDKRDQLKEQAESSLLFLLEQIKQGVCHNKTIEAKMSLLTKRLMNTNGKKVYGYLKADVKAIVDLIVDELANEDKVAACYERWLKYQDIKDVILCLDHDAAGIEACGRLADILLENNQRRMKVLQPQYKDWNEDLKARSGVKSLPAEAHPQILECCEWVETMKEVCRNVDMRYTTRQYLMQYYRKIYEELKKGLTKENLENAFDSHGLILSGIAVKCIEKYSREMGKEISTDEVLDCIRKRYYPHRDKGNIKNRISQFQKVFDETMAVFDNKDLASKENMEAVVRKCMGLTMECVKAHIFVSSRMKEQTMERGVDLICSQ